MACTSSLLVAGIGVECLSSLGGCSNVYIAETNDITAITEASGTVSAITLASLQHFYEFVFHRTTEGTASFTETAVINLETGSTYYDQTVTMQLRKRDAVKRGVIDTLVAGQKPLTIIVKDQNGTYWILGKTAGLFVSELTGGSGVKKADMNGYTVSFKGFEALQASEVNSSLISSLL